jgi:beta-barrel assembly-enhancing protease
VKFVAREPSDDVNVNVSKTSPLKEVSLLTAGLVGLFVSCLAAAFLLVDLTVFFVSPEMENRLFNKVDWNDLSVLGGGESQPDKTVEEVFLKLTQHWKDSPYDFKVRVSNVDIPNAFALPGGTIVVTRALRNMVDSENELAFVLGHELGHFHNRDHLRRMGRLMAGQFLVSALFSSTSGGGVKDSIVWMEKIILLGFSREQESAADRFGAALVMQAYGHLGGAKAFFNNLKDAAPNMSGFSQGFLSTHPVHDKRIEDLAKYADQEGWSAEGNLLPFKGSAKETMVENRLDAGMDGDEPQEDVKLKEAATP